MFSFISDLGAWSMPVDAESSIVNSSTSITRKKQQPPNINLYTTWVESGSLSGRVGPPPTEPESEHLVPHIHPLPPLLPVPHPPLRRGGQRRAPRQTPLRLSGINIYTYTAFTISTCVSHCLNVPCHVALQRNLSSQCST